MALLMIVLLSAHLSVSCWVPVSAQFSVPGSVQLSARMLGTRWVVRTVLPLVLSLAPELAPESAPQLARHHERARRSVSTLQSKTAELTSLPSPEQTSTPEPTRAAPTSTQTRRRNRPRTIPRPHPSPPAPQRTGHQARSARHRSALTSRGPRQGVPATHRAYRKRS